MKIVVFGGSGFLGSHVVDVLAEKKHNVVIYDLKPSPYLHPSQEMIVGDVLDARGVENAVQGADIVYNFTGISDIDDAKTNPLETVKQSIVGNSVILEACRKKGIKRFLFASSIYVYSNAGSFYRSCKQACELLIEDYQKAYGIDFTILRYGSIYGPRTDEKNWIHKILKQALAENKITREGDGEEIREYIHVHDAARISIDVLGEEYINQRVIISGNQPIKIKDLLVMIKEILNNKIKIEYTAPKIEEHYKVTPYSFNPKIAKKIFNNSYLDLGQGFLDMLDKINKEFHVKK